MRTRLVALIAIMFTPVVASSEQARSATACGGAESCWHVVDARKDLIAYGIPESHAQPLHLACASPGRLVVHGYVLQRKREQIKSGQKISVRLSGRGWSRILESRASCEDGCSFQGEIAADHPLVRSLLLDERVHYSRAGQEYSVPGRSARAVVSALLSTCSRVRSDRRRTGE
jgi:hypothetical protein